MSQNPHHKRLRAAGFKPKLKIPRFTPDRWRKLALNEYRQHMRLIDKKMKPEDCASFRMHVVAKPNDDEFRRVNAHGRTINKLTTVGGAPKHLRARKPKDRPAKYHVAKLLDLGVSFDQLTFEHPEAWREWHEEVYNG